MQKITPFLWFDGNAEEAVIFYTSVFKDAKLGRLSRAGDKVLVASIQLFGQEFLLLNGGPLYQFSPAISFVVNCEAQEEVDYYWERLGQGGVLQQCGWLQDKFGVSWQIVPTLLGKLMSDPDKAKAGRVMQAMLGMVKLDIAGLQRAYDQEG